VFPHPCSLARRHSAAIRAAAGGSYLCHGEAKVLDNAVDGYMLTRFSGGSGSEAGGPVGKT
jgi:hypothetical protein